MAVKLLRKNNSDAITSAMDAAMYYMTIGEGFFGDIYGSCSASESNNTLTIQSGLMSIGGRLVEIPENDNYTLDLSGYVSKSVYIKMNITIEDDDSASTVTIYASTDSSESTRRALMTSGTYTTNLFYLEANGSTHSIARKLALLSTGVAKNASTLLSTGKIGNTLTTDIFTFDTDKNVTNVKKAKYSEHSTYSDGLAYITDNDGHNLNAVSSTLYMPYRKVYLCVDSVVVNNKVMTADEIKAMNTAVTISADDNAVEIPFDEGASLDSINSYALVRLFVDGNYYDTYGTGIENYSSFTFSNVTALDKVEVVLNFNESKVRMRFGKKATAQHTFSLHVLGMGVTA
jgi:hypothetical protein